MVYWYDYNDFAEDYYYLRNMQACSRKSFIVHWCTLGTVTNVLDFSVRFKYIG